MTDHPQISVAEANQLRRAELVRKLAARRRMPGYDANCREIEAEIARIDEESAAGSDGADPQSSDEG